MSIGVGEATVAAARAYKSGPRLAATSLQATVENVSLMLALRNEVLHFEALAALAGQLLDLNCLWHDDI